MNTEKRASQYFQENNYKDSSWYKTSLIGISALLRDLLNKEIKLQKLIIISLILLTSPFHIFAQLPDLGSSINFAVFTTIGALGNTGVSTINGNIGTNDGDITGFGAPTLVNGDIEWLNAVTAQAALDVQAAYNEIFNTPATEPNHTPAFGNDETLLAGVYSVGGAGSIAGNLYLDAAGDPDAIFIFQFAGAFTTGASSTVSLLNGASACNIFWIAEGAIAMAALTDMKGTVIANNGAVSMGAGGLLNGRLLSTVGAASVYDVVISTPNCGNLLLPIDLLSFTSHCDEQDVSLNWRTASETNNDYFTIERSTDGINWQIAGIIEGSGNSASQRDYEFRDMNENESISYYSLMQTDFNGNNTYESVISQKNCKEKCVSNFSVYPNPSNGKFTLLSSCNSEEVKSIEIYNSQGQQIFNSLHFESTFDISENNPGFYYMRILRDLKIVNLKISISD